MKETNQDYFYDYVEEHIRIMGVNPHSFDWECQVYELRAQFMTPFEVAEKIVNAV